MKKLLSLETMLNSAQMEAVMFREGSLLVIAGAGSGKTRTLTYRVAALVDEGVSPKSILLLTFTRKAAHEMLKRATLLLDERCGNVSGGTFHSFANTILRRYAKEVGFSEGYAILDKTDAEDLISLIRKDSGLSSKYHSFPTKKTLMDIFSRSTNKVLPLEDIVYNEYPHFSHVMDSIHHIHEEYTARKKVYGFMDYDDLLILLRNLLKENDSLCQRISASYRYVMVDEYQDTNKIQAEILYLLSSANKNVMVVGDDSQSIYAFRGANFKNIINFPEIFPGTKIIRLEENYRSVQPILTLTNEIIEGASEKYSKRLFTQKQEGRSPLLVDTENESGQSRFVVDTIHELNRDGIAMDEIAVLFRAGFHSFNLEIELAREGISFNKVGGFKFMESAHIKDVLAHLKVLTHPDDRISWHRTLSLVEKIGPAKAQKIYEAISKGSSGCHGLVNTIFPAGIEKHLQELKKLFSGILAEEFAVWELGELVINYYAPILKQKFDDYPKRLKDLEQLVVIMEQYQDLFDFLSDMALEPPNTSSDNIMKAAGETDKLTLSTIHSAKGLEWHTVFVLWVLDGRFPSIYAIEDEDSLEEERRLMYVAATRAKENLYFIYPKNIYERNERVILTRPSRFLEEIKEEILKKQSVGYDSWSF